MALNILVICYVGEEASLNISQLSYEQ